MRPSAERLAVGLLFGCLAFAAVAKGAFFVVPLRVLEGCALVAFAAALRAGRRGSAIPFVAAAVVGAWCVASALHAGDVVVGAEQALFLLALAAAASAVSTFSEQSADEVLLGVVAAGTIVSVTAAVGLAAHVRPWALPLNDAWRASSTITYANATACVAVLTAAVCVTTPRGSLRLRQALVSIALVGAAVTLCRASVTSALVGIGALAVLGRAGLVRPYVASVVVAFVAFLGFVPAFRLTEDANPVWPLVSCIIAAAVLWWWPRVETYARRAPARTWGLAVTAVGLAAALVGVVWSWSPVTSRIASLGSVSGRALSWQAYVDFGWSDPVFGIGPSAFRVHMGRGGGALLFAHNEYLQTFAEMGLVGLALVVAALVWLAWRARNRSRPTGLVVGAVVCSFALTDFVWNVPLIPFIAAIALGDALRRSASSAS